MTTTAPAKLWSAVWNSPTSTRMRPYPPSLTSTPPRMSATGADASAWASMNHVWKGKAGSFTAKAMKKSHAIRVAIAVGSTTS